MIYIPKLGIPIMFNSNLSKMISFTKLEGLSSLHHQLLSLHHPSLSHRHAAGKADDIDTSTMRVINIVLTLESNPSGRDGQCSPDNTLNGRDAPNP
jgi:hypothetical protein